MFEDPADEPEDKDHQTKQTITPSAGYPIDTKSSGDDRAFGETHTSAASAAVARVVARMAALGATVDATARQE